jgi:predicted N-acetyltransferase YhbS
MIMIYMLAPVAVSTQYQGQGVGQVLIKYGVGELKQRAVSVVITCGDPSFYSKVGFQSLSIKPIQAPLALSMPEGWLGLSLIQAPTPTLSERPTCVEAFNNPAYW